MKSNSEFRLRPLGELCEVTGGSSAPQGEEFFRGGTIPFVRMRDLGAYHHTTQLDTTRDAVTPEAVEKKRLKIFEPGCILFPRSGSVQLNHRAILAIRASIVSHIGILQKFAADIDVRYFYWFFVSYDMGSIAKQTTGLDLVNFSDVKKISIPVPETIKEQRRIVAEIEKQFTRLEAGVAALRRVQANLKRYRAAVLKAACEGQLVDSDLSKWKRVKVSEVGEAVTGNTPPTSDPENLGDEVPFFKPTDLDAGYNVREARQYLSAKGAKLARILPAGSVLVTCIGATIGKTGFARVECATNQQINALVVNPKIAISAWAFWAFTSPDGQQQIKENASATTLPILNKSKFQALEIPLPPLAEQTRIVAEVERRLSVVEELKSVVSANLQRATRLRQSILQKAFAGELIAQESPVTPTNIIPLLKIDQRNSPNRHFARALLSAEIVHRLHREPTFGRIKHQKIFHLCEHIAGIEEINGQYHREAAGPLDNKLIDANEAELKKQKWYHEVRRESFGHAYEPLPKAGDHRKYVEGYWPEKLPIIEKLIELMRAWSTDRCEIFCTAYAAWNDLILWGKPATEENILREILERWHDSKKRIPKERWLKAISWMKEKGFTPIGFGKPTGKLE